jgi:hypothetical protein
MCPISALEPAMWGKTVLGSARPVAAILKSKMAATFDRILHGTRPKIDKYPKIYLSAKFGAFFTI